MYTKARSALNLAARGLWKNMRRTALLFLILCCLTRSSLGDEIKVAAAADLNYALKDLAARFEKQTGNTVSLTFGASGNFYSQIQNGAPFDLFFSADADYPKKLATAGLMDNASLRTYAVGHLVLWHPNIGESYDRLPITREQITNILLRPDVKRIAIANPEHAPYGRAAMAVLERFGLKDKIADKLVLGENVSQAVQFVQSGNAQVGLVALSLLLSPTVKNPGPYDIVPQDAYPEIRQAVGILSSSQHKKTAQAFIDYVGSPEGAAILKQYGFGLPSQK